jgi:transcriptional regulator with XRE-family HTH domain
MALAEKLKALRVKTNKSLQDVATEVGASKQHIWDLETGRAVNPGIDLLTKLSRCFNVSVADLIGETPEGSDEPSELVAMYRDLKNLSPADQQAIQDMMRHFLKRPTDKA